MFEPVIEFRRRLQEGQFLIGPGIYFTDPQSTEALAHSADFLWYDLEHQPMSLDVLRGHLMVARHMNTPAFVRVPGPHPGPAVLKPILDIGAHGIIVPQVRSAEEVRQIVSDCRYPPMGQRGIWPMIPTNYGRDDLPEFMKESNRQLWVCVMIETIEAVEAIDEIVAIEGLDSIVIGPMDLSASCGVLGRIDDPKVVASMEKAIAAARAVGKPVGCGLDTSVERIVQFAGRGIQWFQTGGDCPYVVEFQDDLFAKLRDKLRARAEITW